mgnify:CR=1 FL=1
MRSQLVGQLLKVRLLKMMTVIRDAIFKSQIIMYVNSYSNRARSRRDDESTIPEINLLKNQDAGESEALTKAQNSI